MAGEGEEPKVLPAAKYEFMFPNYYMQTGSGSVRVGFGILVPFGIGSGFGLVRQNFEPFQSDEDQFNTLPEIDLGVKHA